ncbi:MAG: FAD-dependent oxidoreductase, partial [Bryobacteraceae bacterium]
MTRIAIVGGGIIGLASAYRLCSRFASTEITVLEKEPRVGTHQTGHNSGVLHCGIYYKPGSVKARLAVTGIRQMIEFCRENAVAHEICGKIIVATDESELPRLQDLHQRGIENGLEGLEMLTPDEMREIEPHVAGVAALRVPQEGIVDYAQVCEALVSHIEAANTRVITNAQVIRLDRHSGIWTVKTTSGDFDAAIIHLLRVVHFV